MTLPVTDEQARQIRKAGRTQLCDVYDCPSCISGKHRRWGPGIAYLVIPGGEYVPAPTSSNEIVKLYWHPPAVWVALAEATCDTYGETHIGRNDGSGTGRCESEPPCWEGRPVHPITTECDHRACSLDKREQGIEWVCDHWRTDGRQVLGEVTVTKLIPTIREGDEPPSRPYIEITMQGLALLFTVRHEAQVTDRINLIGDPSPGDWVAILQVVQR